MRIGMAVGVVVVLLIPCSAWGMWAWTDPQTMVDQADFVVRGKIVDANKEAGQANIKVEETLKGAAREKIPVMFSPVRAGGLMASDDQISYAEGMEGIWILERPDKDGRYDLRYPLRRMQVEEIDKAKALVETFKAIKWGKPVNGLAGAVRALPVPNQELVNTFGLYLAVKNVSDKPLTVQQSGGGLAMHFMLKGPDGERAVNMPETKGTGLPTSVRLEPGQVIYVGFGWPAALNTGALKPGDSTVTGTYSFQPEALDRAPLNLWTGKIETEPLELKVANK